MADFLLPVVQLLLVGNVICSQAIENNAADNVTADAATADDLFLGIGVLDIVILGILGFLGYRYFYSRKRRDVADDPSMGYVIQSSPAVSSAGSDGEANKGFIAKMKNSKRRLVSFYGSQTGTAEEYSSRLAKEGQMYGLRGIVADPEECDMEDLSKLKEVGQVLDGDCLAIFCLATYGEGDPTDNAQEFFDWLQSGGGDLSGMKYSVFGLGNKTYEHYNSMGIYVDKRLEELGAHRIHPLGLGDDDSNLEDDFITWKEAFWASVCKELGVEAIEEEVNMRHYKQIVFRDGEFDPARVFGGEPARLRSYKTQRPPFDAKNPYMATVTANRNVYSAESDRYCMHVELCIASSSLRYEAGDHVAVFPTNDANLVDELGKLLEVDLDTTFSLKSVDEDVAKINPFPCPTTYRVALSHYVDVTAIPRTHVLKALADHTTDAKEKDMLVQMSGTSPEGKDLYASWVIDSCRHITHILEDLPNCKPPIDYVMELLPRLQPRFYSISSSSKLHKDSIHITAVLIQYETPTGRTNRGVATSWMKPMVPSVPETTFKMPIYVRRSQFRLPRKATTPVVMVGPGTGIAPFRGFIQERAWLKRQGKEVGATHLYFGCRHRDTDYLYREELEEYMEEGVVTVHAAFSRDQPEKRYVTHLLKEDEALLWKLIGEENGHFYVCGDAKNMAKDVNKILKEIVDKYGGEAVGGAEAYIKKLEQQKRFSADVWS